MGVFNNLVMYKQDVAQNSLDTIVPDLATSWSWSADRTKLTFKLREGVKWHDGKPFTAKDVKCTFDMLMGKSSAKFRKNPRKTWYDNVTEVTTNGDFEAAFNLKRPPAGAAGPARLGLHAGLSLPCLAGRHAHASDRHRAVQVRRIQDQRIDQADAQSGLLEEGAALSRRDRIHHHPEPLDSDPRLHRRQVRHDLPDRGDDSAAEGREEPGAEGDLRGGADQRQHQPDRQSRLAAVRQSGHPQGDGDDARSQGLRRHPVRGTGGYRRRHAAAAARRLGAAAGDPADHSRLRSGRQEEPRRGAQADAEGRLRTRQAAQDQGLDPQHRRFIAIRR